MMESMHEQGPQSVSVRLYTKTFLGFWEMPAIAAARINKMQIVKRFMWQELDWLTFSDYSFSFLPVKTGNIKADNNEILYRYLTPPPTPPQIGRGVVFY
jgi:hypothetical protein